MESGERSTRIQKVNELRDLKINPYADKFLDRIKIKDLNKQGVGDFEQMQIDGAKSQYRIAGRLTLIREHGKLIFARLKDYSGEIQIAFVQDKFELYSQNQKVETIKPFEFAKKYLDMGDFVGVEGDLFKTKHGELTLFVSGLHFLSKTILPMPEKFHGLGDNQENRYRQRYLDMLVADEQGEQTELEFLKNDDKFKKYYLGLLANPDNQDWIDTVKKVIEFRINKLGENAKSDLTESNYDYLFELFVKSNKVRDFVMEKLQPDMPAYYLAVKFRMNTKLRFQKRTQVINSLRNYLVKNDFMEVETPVLSNKASGALAKPFATHHNAYDMDVFLRIAPETYLKRAVVGGLERVFEFARCFRNEGLDPSHLQDFTMLEFYRAYADFEYLMNFTEQMFKDMIQEVFGTMQLLILDKEGNPVQVDFGKSWQRKTIFDLIKPYFPELEDLWKSEKIQEAKQLAKTKLQEYITPEEMQEMQNLGWGNFIDFVYKKTARKTLIEPVFVINHPIELSPLARKNDENRHVVDRFQLVVNGWEIINAYSELIDPIDQMERFVLQTTAKKAGDEEAHDIDQDYVQAMEHGMPPMAGWGSGIDRLVALLTSQDNIKDIVMFPLMKPIEKTNNTQKIDKKDVDTNGDEDMPTWEQAKALVDKYINQEYVKNHSLETGYIMKALANRLGENEQKRAIAGLLHDLDMDIIGDDYTDHGDKTLEILSQEGITLPQDMAQAILAHTETLDVHKYQRTSKFDYALSAAESLTGILFAYVLMKPDKKLEGTKVKSIKKKLKDKSFAAKVDRALIYDIDKVGLDLDEFIQISIDALLPNAQELGM